MKARILDKKALVAVRPEALSAYARAHGWKKDDRFGRYSHVYVRDGAPEIIVPGVQRLGDYASVVLRLVEIFAEVSKTDEISLYRGLLTFDRDIVRVRAATDSGNGSVALDDGVSLITGARDMMRAAARSLHKREESLRGRMNQDTKEYLRNVQLGQTEHGSFVVTLLGPVVSPPPAGPNAQLGTAHDSGPLERKMTQHLEDALRATREAADRAVTNRESTAKAVSLAGADAFFDIVERGASINLFKAIAMMIGGFSEIDITLSWAFTHPMAAEKSVRFRASDARILREGEKLLRNERSQDIERNFSLVGRIQKLKRDNREADGMVTMSADIAGRIQSVEVALDREEYERAIGAHRDQALVRMTGDLERGARQRRLRGARITNIGFDEDGESGVLQGQDP